MNSTARIGVLLSNQLPDDSAAACLTEVQHDLFDLGGELSIPGSACSSTRQRVAWLDAQLEQFNQLAAAAARNSCCRAAARRHPPATSRAPSAGAPSAAAGCCRATNRYHRRRCSYLNRLSDLLFVLARLLRARASAAASRCGIARDSPIRPARTASGPGTAQPAARAAAANRTPGPDRSCGRARYRCGRPRARGSSVG